jgi:hypothetical protein
MKVTFSTLTLFLIFNASVAQELGNRDNMLVELSKRAARVPDVDYEGSPFLNETFVEGEIYTFKNKFIGIPLRYNIFYDNMEFKQNNAVLTLVAEPIIKKVIFGGNTFIVEPMGKGKFGFLALLDSGKVVLMSKKVVMLREKKKGTGFEEASPAKFIRGQDLYFYKIGERGITKVSSLKSLIESLPDRQDDVNQFVKKEKISVKKEEDLVKVIKYYNSL